MSDDFDQIQALAGALLRQLGAGERRTLLRRMAHEVRKSQSDRIARQQDPEGQPFAPRRAQTSRFRRKGRIRQQAMFRKLRGARFLRADATDREAWIGFSGRASRIARVHQEGLPDKPSARAKAIEYAKRRLLGLTEAEQSRALDMLVDHIAGPR